MRIIQPWCPESLNPFALGIGRRIAGAHNALALGWIIGTQPTDQCAELNFCKVWDFIEPDVVVRAPLVFKPIINFLDASKLQNARAAGYAPNSIL